MCFGLLLLESCLASKLLLPLSEAWDEHGEELGKADLAHSSYAGGPILADFVS